MPRLLLCIVLFFCVLTGYAPVAAQHTAADLATLFDGIDLRPAESAFIAPPREVIRPLIRCKILLAKNEVADAVEILGELLADDTAEDFLIPRGSTSFESLRSRTERILGSIDDRFLEPYQVRYDIRARKLLDKGVAESDSALLKKVSNQFFFTESGSEAAMLLGHMDLSIGQPSAAQSWFAKVVRFPATAKRHDPEASILLATCQLLGNNERRARETLLSLKNRMPNSSISFQGKAYPLFDQNEKALPWLTSLIGDSPLASSQAFSKWLMFQGNPSRTGKIGTGMPLLAPRWEHSIGGTLSIRNETKIYLEELVQDGLAPAPASQPLVVGETIVYRDIERLYGVDFKTGRRQWAWPPQLGWNQKADSEVKLSKKSKLYQRLVLDSIFGQASSDGRLVFFIPHPGSSSEVNYDNAFDDATSSDPDDVREYNELVAIDAQQSGLLSWRVGGPSGLDEPKLAKTYFIGEPLPLEGVLYSCCVRENAIQLVALDAKTGRLRWSQAIASYSGESFNANHFRRLAGVTPSYADGKIVCLTGTGGVVAIEVATRNLLWGYEYRLPQNKKVFSESSNYANALNDVWRDSQVTISNGMVYLTPVLSRHLICLNLENGEGVWYEEDGFLPRRVGRQSSLYLAGVERNRLILLGAKDVRSVDAMTGQEKWKLDLPEGDLLSGRGYIGEGSLYVPTTTQKILRVDLASGKIAESVMTGRILGNLSRVQGDVVSHGIDHVASYPEMNATRRALEGGEGEDSADKQKFVKAQLMIQDGNAEAGLDLLVELAKGKADASISAVFISLVVNLRADDPRLSMKALDALKTYFPGVDVSELEKSRMLSKLRVGEFEESLKLGLDEIEKAFEAVCSAGEAKLSDKIQRRITATLVDYDQPIDADVDVVGGVKMLGPENRDDAIHFTSFGWTRAKLIMAMEGLIKAGDKEVVGSAKKRISAMVTSAMQQPDEQFEWLIAHLHERLMGADTLEQVSRHYLGQRKYLHALMYANSAIRVRSDGPEAFQLLRAEVFYEGGDLRAALAAIDEIESASLSEGVRAKFETLKEKTVVALETNRDPLQLSNVDKSSWLPLQAAIASEGIRPISKKRVYRLTANFDPATPANFREYRIAWCPWGEREKEFEVRNSCGTLARSLQIRNNDDNRSFGYSNSCEVDFQNHAVEFTLNKLTYFIDWFKVISGEGGNLWMLPDEQVSKLRTAFSGGREFIYAQQGWLNCHETLTGKLIWKRRLGKKINRAVAHGQEVTAWSEAGRFFKTVDVATGRLVRTLKSSRHMVSRTLGSMYVVSHPIRKGELAKDVEQKFADPNGKDNPAKVALKFGVFDPVKGRVVWERVLDTEAKIFYRRQEMCVLDPFGKLTFYGLAAGDVVGEIQLPLSREEMDEVNEFDLRRHEAGWVVHLNMKDGSSSFARGKSSYRYVRLHVQLRTGPVFLIDHTRTNLVWESPVYLEKMEYMNNQPADSPAILFGRHIERRADENETHHIQTVVLDSKNGSVIDSFVIKTLENYNGHSIEWTPAKDAVQRKLVVSTAAECKSVSFAIDDELPPIPRTHLTFNGMNFFEDRVFEKPTVKLLDLREDEFRVRAKEAALRKAARKSEAAAELRSRMKIRSD